MARDGNDWLLADAVGSVRATVDQAGVVSAETAFTAYGEPLAGNTDSFGFAGEQLDTTGLLHLRARQYNPTVGRFTSVDPVQPGAPGTTGYNLYTYAANNPTTFTDPTGESVLTERALLQVVRAQTFIATSARTQAVLAWIAANPLALCGAGATAGGAAYYFSGNRTYGDAAIGALEGCEAGLSITELADSVSGLGARPSVRPDQPDNPANDLRSSTRSLADNEPDGDFGRIGVNNQGVAVHGSDGAIDADQVEDLVTRLSDDGPVLVLTGVHGSRTGQITPERQFTAQDLDNFRALGNVQVRDIFDEVPRSQGLDTLFNSSEFENVVLAFCNSRDCVFELSIHGLTSE